MPIRVSCICGQAFQANDTLAGKQARCPKCGNVLLIPQLVPTPSQPSGFQGAFPAQSQAMPSGFGTPAPLSQSPLSNPYPMGQSAFGAAPASWQTQQNAPRKKKGGNRGLLIGLIVGAAVLVIGATIAVVLVIVLSQDDVETASAEPSDSKPSFDYAEGRANEPFGSNAAGFGITPSTSNSTANETSDSQYTALVQQQESLMNEMLGEFDALLSALDTVRDRQSGAAAAPTIDRIRQRVPEILEQVKAMPRLKREDESRLKRIVDTRMRSVQSRIVSSTQRAALRSQNEPQFMNALQLLGSEWQHLDRF